MRPIRFVLAFTCIAALAATAVGCSDPVPLIPQGAWALTFQDPGGDCNVSGHNAGVGKVAAEGDIEYKSDGTDDAEVTCTVEPAGSAFHVDGTVRFKGQYLSLDIPELKAGATVDEPSTGSLEFLTGQTGDIYRSNACNFYLVKDNGQKVENGVVWGSFQCPSVDGAAGDVCAVQQGFFAFTNCVGGSDAEEEEE